MQNITCARTIVPKPRLSPRLRKSVSRDAASTTSGVAIGRKISRLVPVRPRKRCRVRANATIVPRIVATTVARTPILRLFPSALQTSGAPQGLVQFAVVNPRQVRLSLPPWLNENTAM